MNESVRVPEFENEKFKREKHNKDQREIKKLEETTPICAHGDAIFLLPFHFISFFERKSINTISYPQNEVHSVNVNCE